MSGQINISFGALAPTIAEQLEKQNVGVEPERLEHFQKDADAISRLHVRGLIPDSVAKNIREKLMKKIAFAAYRTLEHNEQETE